MGRSVPVEERFWARVVKTGSCWLWNGAHFSTGYALLNVERKPKGAHRIAYELLVGPIPDGAQLDHLCRVRGCVNPAHLEPVSGRTNLMRGETRAAENAAKTHCPQGHPYNEENTYRINGHRVCRTCNLARSRRNYERAMGRPVDPSVWPRCRHPRTPENASPTSKPGGRCKICRYAANRASDARRRSS